MDGPAVNTVIDDLKRLEHEGYHFEAADASLELLMRRAAGWQQNLFSIESMRVITDELPNGQFNTEATVKVHVKNLLKKIGFRYRNQVDPFDGGPHLWAKRDELVPLRKARRARFSGGEVRETEGVAEQGLLCRVAQEPGTFRAAHVLAEVSKDGVRIVFRHGDEQAALDRALGIRPGDEVVFMPYY